MDDVFQNFYDKTKSIFGASEAWKVFWEDMGNKQSSFIQLKQKLEKDGVIAAGSAAQEIAKEGDSPF